jgi:hypothetical protein
MEGTTMTSDCQRIQLNLTVFNLLGLHLSFSAQTDRGAAMIGVQVPNRTPSESFGSRPRNDTKIVRFVQLSSLVLYIEI